MNNGWGQGAWVYVLPLMFCIIVFTVIWLIGIAKDKGVISGPPYPRPKPKGLIPIFPKEPKESPREKWDNANQLGMFLDQHINVLRLVETGQITVKCAIEALCIFRAGNTPELPELEYRKLDRDWL